MTSTKKPRARQLGIPFDGCPGPLNAITDVPGVKVGFCTLVEGEGKLTIGKGPIRTGVTAVVPRGKSNLDRCFAAWFSLNGNGEMTGTTWIEESGCLEGPVLITNTHSVGVVRDAVIGWMQQQKAPPQWCLPVVAETYDGFLNDINGFHVQPEHVLSALNDARSGPIAEGNVGGGTGMTLYQFKGGTGTASRLISFSQDQGYTVGVLVQANYGKRDQLRVAGIPVGREIEDLMPITGEEGTVDSSAPGSIIIVIATDAPLIPVQLKALVKRASLGLARNGSIAEHTSGDIFIAFSTGNRVPSGLGTDAVDMLANEQLTPLFGAAVEATEEAVLNALVAAETMSGINGNTAYAVPIERLRAVLRKYNRLLL
ncbi:MAG: P1 family peptidase [Arenicellales bacterium]|nr:P1 family peptidase [Arenicellales bacterium]